MELPTRQDFLSGRIKLNPLINVRYLVFTYGGTAEDYIKSIGGIQNYKPMIGKAIFLPGGKSLSQLIAESGSVGTGGLLRGGPDLGGTGDLGGLGGFGFSKMTFGVSGEVERARLDILERMKRTTDSRAKSRLTLPRLFGDGNKEKNILADVL